MASALPTRHPLYEPVSREIDVDIQLSRNHESGVGRRQYASICSHREAEEEQM